MNEQKMMQTVLSLAEAIVNMGYDMRRLRISLLSVQTILAAQVNPAHPQEALQEILDRDQYAQSLAPSPEIEKVQALIQAIKNGTWGQA